MYNIKILKNKSNTLLINYNNKGLLLDTGYDEDDTRKIIKYLKKNDIELEAVIVSHYHRDHIQGVSVLKKTFPTAKFYSSKTTKFIYENNWLENDLYFDFVDTNHSIDVDFIILGNMFKFYEINIEILKSNGHCYGNLVFKIDDCLFCPDIVIADNKFLPFISDVSSYFEDIYILKKIKDINTVILTHNPNTMTLDSFAEKLENTKNIIDKYINNIEKLINKNCTLEMLIIKSIETNNRTKCFNTSMTKEQYGYTLFVIKNILKYLVNIKKIDLIYKEGKIIIKAV